MRWGGLLKNVLLLTNALLLPITEPMVALLHSLRSASRHSSSRSKALWAVTNDECPVRVI